jgi:hypothetical protein
MRKSDNKSNKQCSNSNNSNNDHDHVQGIEVIPHLGFHTKARNSKVRIQNDPLGSIFLLFDRDKLNVTE